MITQEQAMPQIARLSGLRFFPDQIPAIQELVLALAEAAKTEEHARTIVTGWLRENEVCPTPSHFYRLIEETPSLNNGKTEFLR